MKEKQKKLAKGIDETFVDSIASITIDELKARIVQLQIQNDENESFKESESYLAAQAEYDYAKEQYQLTVGPVKETTTIIKNKTKMIIERLKEKGGA